MPTRLTVLELEYELSLIPQFAYDNVQMDGWYGNFGSIRFLSENQSMMEQNSPRAGGGSAFSAAISFLFWAYNPTAVHAGSGKNQIGPGVLNEGGQCSSRSRAMAV